MSQRIRTFIVDGNRLLRETLRRILQKRADICVAGESSSASVDVRPILESKADVVLIGASALETTCEPIEVLRRTPLAPHIVLIGMEENESIFLESVRAGADGYLLKDASATDVMAAIRAVSQGEAVCSPRLCRALFRHVVREKDAGQAIPRNDCGLTRRQLELVPLIAQGLTNKEIASHFNLSEQTIKNHIHRMLQRVGAEDRLEVTRIASSRKSPVAYRLDS